MNLDLIFTDKQRASLNAIIDWGRWRDNEPYREFLSQWVKGFPGSVREGPPEVIIVSKSSASEIEASL